MADWMKVGTDVLVGAAAGAIDQLVQNMDEKKALEMRVQGKLDADKKMPVSKQIGTYVNYGLPILAIVGVATNFLRGDWATRAVVAGSQMAGRKITHQMTTTANSSTPSAAYTEWARRAAAAAQSAAQRTYEPEFSGAGIV